MRSQEEPITDGAFNVTENMFEGLEMNISGRVHKLIEFVDCISNVWTSERAVLQATTHLSI